jgi:hypothetical protein
VHPNELLARREIELISKGDVAGPRRLYADDCDQVRIRSWLRLQRLPRPSRMKPSGFITSS